MSAFLRILVSVFVLALTVPAMAQDGARQIETTENADYFGFDLRTVQDVELEQCKAACLDDGQCKAFTYNVKAAWCFLKSDYNSIKPFAGAIAGRVVSAGEQDLGAAPDLAFLPASLLDEARAYRERTIARNDGAAESGAANLVLLAKSAVADGNMEGALRFYAMAAAADPGRSPIWAELSRQALAYTTQDANLNGSLRSVAISSAINAYQTSRTASARAQSLAVLGEALERAANWRPALAAYKASLDISEVPALRAAYADLRARQGFRVLDNTVDADTETPRVCVQFSEDLVKSQDYSGYVSIDGASNVAVETDTRQICVNGLEHGQRYRLVLRDGLPSAVGETLEAPVELSLYVRDRAPTARFTGSNFVLPDRKSVV